MVSQVQGSPTGYKSKVQGSPTGYTKLQKVYLCEKHIKLEENLILRQIIKIAWHRTNSSEFWSVKKNDKLEAQAIA